MHSTSHRPDKTFPDRWAASWSANIDFSISNPIDEAMVQPFQLWIENLYRMAFHDRLKSSKILPPEQRQDIYCSTSTENETWYKYCSVPWRYRWLLEDGQSIFHLHSMGGTQVISNRLRLQRIYRHQAIKGKSGAGLMNWHKILNIDHTCDPWPGAHCQRL